MNASKCFWHCARQRQHTKDTKLNVICQLLQLCFCVSLLYFFQLCFPALCVSAFPFSHFCLFSLAVCLGHQTQVHLASCQQTAASNA